MTDRRRAVVSAVAAAALFAAAVVVIVVLGRTSPPSFPPLAQQLEPRVEGVVAYLAQDDDDSPCVAVVDVSDASRRVLGCPADRLYEVRVTGGTADEGGLTVEARGEHPGGRLVVRYDASGRTSRRVVTGPETRSPGEPAVPGGPPPPGLRPVPDGAQRSDGTRAVTGFGDARAEVTVLTADGRIVAKRDFDGGDYAVTRARWTDDGRWLLLWDTAGRLLVADAQLRDIRVVADDVAGR